MKSVLLSIKPKYCELIAGGIKTIEVRKTKPKFDTPFKCYIYCTKAKSKNLQLQGKVIGEFVCDEIFPIRVFENGTIQDYMFRGMKKSCVPYDDIVNYIGNGCIGYGWHISNLVMYQEPNEIIRKWCEEHYNETGWELTSALDKEWNRNRKLIAITRHNGGYFMGFGLTADKARQAAVNEANNFCGEDYTLEDYIKNYSEAEFEVLEWRADCGYELDID